jgi:tetratricopeptide (TPR) repeat protein
MTVRAWHGAVLVGLLAVATALVFVLGKGGAQPLGFTVGDVQATHAEVKLGERAIFGLSRVKVGDRLSTGPQGRARLRLDDGTLVAMDSSTSLKLEEGRLALDSGRIFVQQQGEAATEVTLAGVTTRVASSAAAFEQKPAAEARIYCASGELVATVSNKPIRIQSGESGQIRQGQVQVEPEKAFDDWTGGLAVPWTSAVAGRSAIPILEGANRSLDAGVPFSIRSHRVHVEIDGEVSVTRARTVYFNGASYAAQGRVRLFLPEDAIVRAVRYKPAGASEFRDAKLEIAGAPDAGGGVAEGLEWAGGGWLRGELSGVDAGKTLELEVEYVQWLNMYGSLASYRYPMQAGDEAPLIGELEVTVDATRAHSPMLRVSAGANVDEQQTIHYRKADTRPTGDLVVELSPRVVKPNVARAYVQPAGKGEDPYVMFRTEVPRAVQPSITLALVIDSSASVGTATLSTERAVIDAIVEGLSANDRLVVLAADQTARPLGVDHPEPVTPKLRAALTSALNQLRPGGASNLGLALQRAADLIDAENGGAGAGSGMVVYVGDGRPNVGATDVSALRGLLRKRAAGMPRTAAIAVGPAANRWLLAKLVAGVGSVYTVLDRSEAAKASTQLLASALEPTVRDVSLELGPHIDRIYPRRSRAVSSGASLSVLGRLRGELPQRIVFKVRNGAELVSESRVLRRMLPPPGADVPQRWALERVKELAKGDEPIEPAIALAKQAGLITPWTSWFFSGGGNRSSLPFGARVLELTPDFDAAFADRVEPLVLTGASLLEPQTQFGGGVTLETAVEAAVRRTLESARKSIRACRDARLAGRPDTGRSFSIQLSVSDAGLATNVSVTLPRSGRDVVLERCIEGVLKSLPYVAAGVAVQVQHTLEVPESRARERTRCSGASKVSLPLRKSLWRSRRPLQVSTYLEAARACELKRWADRRAFLLLMLETTREGEARLDIARELEAADHADAARFIRLETLRQVQSFQELEALSQILIGDEPNVDDEFDKAFKKVTTNEQRLKVVNDFVRLAPHNGWVRRRQLALLEALGHKQQLRQQVRMLRSEAIIDAGLLAQGASALRRIGFEEEGQRTFGDLIERAPRDPWTLAFVGDRLRAEQRFDEAVAAYARLESTVPDDAGVVLRLALAHAGAGRLDVASRLLERITQTGGRGDDGRVGELASIARAVLLAGARPSASPHERELLTRRLLETSLPDVAGVVLVSWPPADDPIHVSIERDAGEGASQSPDFDASSLGLAAFRIERGSGKSRILLERRAEAGPTTPALATVSALIMGDRKAAPKLMPKQVSVAADGKPVRVNLEGGKLL